MLKSIFGYLWRLFRHFGTGLGFIGVNGVLWPSKSASAVAGSISFKIRFSLLLGLISPVLERRSVEIWRGDQFRKEKISLESSLAPLSSAVERQGQKRQN
jgi:hypothetical protein